MPKSFAMIALLAGLVSGATPARAQDDALSFARDIVIPKGQTAGDAVCFLCAIRVEGDLYGDAVTIGGEVEISGRVMGDAVAAGGGMQLASGAKVGGEAVAVGGPLVMAPGAEASGGHESQEWIYLPGQRVPRLKSVVTAVLVNFGLALLALVGARGRRVERVAEAAVSRPLLTLVTGAAVFGVTNLLYIGVASARAATALLAVFVTLWLVASVALGYAGLSLALGRRLAGASRTWLAALAGVAVWTGLQLIPIAGAAVAAVLLVAGLGSTVSSGYGESADWLAAMFPQRRAPTPDSGVGAGDAS